MSSVRHPPLNSEQIRRVEKLWQQGHGLMTIASKTKLPSGTIKPHIDRLERSAERDARIRDRRHGNPYTQHRWEPTKIQTVDEERIAECYNGLRYDDVGPALAAKGAVSPPAAVLTVDHLISRCAAADLDVGPGARAGLWNVGRHVDVTTRQMLKLANSHMTRLGLPPFPDPDAGFLGADRPEASATRMLANFQLLGTF